MKLIKRMQSYNWDKFNRTMRLTTLLLLFTLLRVSASTYSQNTKISLHLKDVSIEDVFKEIERKTEFVFFYRNTQIDLLRKITIDVKKQKVKKILNFLLAGKNVSYEVVDKHIVLNDKKEATHGIKPIDAIKVAMEEQQSKITGNVQDFDGNPLPGVNILKVGTTTGGQSDFDGNFSINAKEGDVLRFSYVGLKTKDVVIGKNTNLKIVLQEDASELNEIVVLGYSSVIKKDLTSSVATINAEKLHEIPATSLGNAIAGRLAGVRVSQSSGKPGRTSSINVRGATSAGFFGNNEALYVIDKVVATKALFDALDVSEVESVTVLKDAASAAVYGARAANGVILVTTRSGKTGAAKLNFTSNIGTTQSTKRPRFTTAYEYSKLINEDADFRNLAADDPARITQTEMDYLKAQNYPNFAKQVEVSPILRRYALNASGGTENIHYFLSGSHIKESGSVANLDYQKTNFRAKVGVDVTENLNVELNLSTSNDLREEFYWRWNGGDEDFGDFYRTFGRNGAWGPPVKNGEYVANFNGWNAANLTNNGAGYNDRIAKNTNINVSATYKIAKIKGLVAGFSYNKRDTQNSRKLFRKPMTDITFGTTPGNRFLLTDEIVGTRVRNDSGADSNSIFQSNDNGSETQINASLRYANTFGDHTVSAFFNYEQWEGEGTGFWGSRRNLLTATIHELFATDGDSATQFTSGSSSENGRQSFIGGLSYKFKDKYLLDASFRRDGSVQFAPDQRFGFFPSVSAGWILSEENFFQEKFEFLDFFKVRYSYGQTGNDDLGQRSFPYIQNYNIGGAGPIFGTSNIQSNAISIQALPNPFITWEKQTSYNFGLDFQVLNSKLATSVDIFTNKKTGLFGNVSQTTPTTFGANLPAINYGAIDIKGFEIVSNYKDAINDELTFEVGVNFGFSTSKFVQIDERDDLRPFEVATGNYTDRIRGYRSLGIIRTQEKLDELVSSGYKFGGAVPKLGELYFEDVRGPKATDPEGNTPDGIVDGNDRVILANHSTSPVNYGLTLGFKYKGFKLQAFMQGFAGGYRFRPQNSRFTFLSPGESAWSNWIDSYHETRPNASYPRVNGWINSTQQTSSFWLESTDFIRMKNLNLGYTVPKSIVQKAGLKDITLFANATNLFLVYSAIKDYDPETTGRVIPTNKTFTLGINVTF